MHRRARDLYSTFMDFMPIMMDVYAKNDGFMPIMMNFAGDTPWACWQGHYIGRAWLGEWPQGDENGANPPTFRVFFDCLLPDSVVLLTHRCTIGSSIRQVDAIEMHALFLCYFYAILMLFLCYFYAHFLLEMWRECRLWGQNVERMWSFPWEMST